MSDHTPIEWTDATWSPWEGCTKISPGCDHCYAEGMNRWLRKGENWGPGAPRRAYSDAHWAKPLAWNAKAAARGEHLRVFPSVCDPFDNEVDPAWRARFFALIDSTPHLTWLLLTKRIGNVGAMIPDRWSVWLPPNVWLGATVINQDEVDRDVPKLLRVKVSTRFLSIEPMLGPVDLTEHLWGRARPCKECPRDADCSCGFAQRREITGEPAIDWVIAGGESGRGARPAHPDWFRSLRDQCTAAGVPFMFKQWGDWVSVSEVEGPGAHFQFPDGATVRRTGKAIAGRTLDGIEHNGVPT